MDGWVKIHRKILEWEWFRYPRHFLLFTYLIIVAAHDSIMRRGVQINRGQVATQLPELSRATGISIQQIRTIMSNMMKSGELTVRKAGKVLIITITYYDKYQDGNSKITRHQTETNTMLSPKLTQHCIQEEKNLRIKKKEEINNTRNSDPQNQLFTDINTYAGSLVEPKKAEIAAHFVEAWNRLSADIGKRPVKLSVARTNKILNFINKYKFNIEDFIKALEMVKSSTFLKQNCAAFCFDWLFQVGKNDQIENITKILDGKYRDNPLTKYGLGTR